MIKQILSIIGMMIVLPFYCLYIIARGMARLLGGNSKHTYQKPKEHIKEFSIDQLEKYDAILDDDE
ncbi:MAG: hypothetical protein GX978_02245 [Tissierellia bacterium]|nr:hypothetical protein [Tissierellia bacterium]